MAIDWTPERIAALSAGEIRTLGNNARARGALDLAALCDEIFKNKFKSAVARAPHPKREASKQVSKTRAFAMRGVTLKNNRWSWGGIRPSDGMVVFTVWQDEIAETASGHEYLLWGPDHDGSRPWSDTLGGREQHAHCRIALAAGEGEGVLIFGERRGRELPPDQPSKVTGADPNTVIRFRVNLRGDEYWAVWDRHVVEPIS